VGGATLTLNNNSGALFLGSTAVGTATLNVSNPVLTFTGSTTDLSNLAISRSFTGTLVLSGLGATYTSATSALAITNAVITAASAANLTTLDGSGTFSGTFSLDPSNSGTNSSVVVFSPASGTVTTGSFSGGSFTGPATLTINASNAATLTLADGSVFHLGTAYNTATSN
jgi:hypothetical protein